MDFGSAEGAQPLTLSCWRGVARRPGCGGDPYNIRFGADKWDHLPIRVGDDAHIVPKA